MGTRPFVGRNCRLNGCAGAVNGCRGRETSKKSKVKRATPPTQRRGTQIPVRNDRPATRRVSESLRSQVIDFKAEKRGRGVCFLARRRLSWLLQAVLEL